MSTKGGNKSRYKKSVQTTLGKARPNVNAQLIDLSHVRKPIDTSIFGLTQVLSLFETATEEVRRYITYECDIMFECRICRTVFRSLANFILHKRNYCTEIYCAINSDNRSDFENEELTIISKDSLSPCSEETSKDIEKTSKPNAKRNLSMVLKKLSDKQDCHKFAESVLKDEVPEKSYMEENKDKQKPCKTIHLEGIENNKEGVFQTLSCKHIGEDLMKSEVMEVHSILNTNEAILGPDGKVFTFKNGATNTVAQKLICTICNLKFATKKTLTHHIKYKHNDTRTVYICPECKDSFANAWCVFRHLYKVHRKSTTQIRRMRDQIHASTIVKKHQEPLKGKGTAILEAEHEAYQEDLQFCEGCDRRFERKAALHSHIQTCSRRLAVIAAKADQKHINEEKMCKEKSVIAKGSSRRKPEICQKIIRRTSLEIIKEKLNAEEPVEGGMSKSKDEKSEKDANSNEIAAVSSYQTHLVQEIILGNSPALSVDREFISCISNAEEILGFLKANSNKIGEADESEQNVDDVANAQEITMCSPADRDVDVHADGVEKDAEIVVDQCEIKEIDDISDEFLKVSAPRQYSSKKNKSESAIKVVNTTDKENVVDNVNNIIDNDINTAEIDLPCDMQSDNVTVAAEYGPPGSNERIYTSDCEQCLCLGDGSNDCSSLCSTERTKWKEGDQPDFVNGEYEERLLPQKNGKKRKLSNEFIIKEGEDISLRDLSTEYVDWNTLSCHPCSDTFPTDDELLEHMALHFNWLRYECTKCNFMSYDRKTCNQHTCTDNTDVALLDNFIVPLPLSKTTSMATAFNHIETAALDEISEEESGLTRNANEIKTQDPSLRKMIMEVIFGSQEDSTEPSMATNTVRPIRNRRSIRTVQKDFEYDMKEVDSKMRKVAAENKVKPIKIVKNDMNFRIVNMVSEDIYKKKRTS